MADNFENLYNGLNLRPQSSDPSNPKEGDIFISDGTPRLKGLWVYKDGSWAQAGGSTGTLDVFHQEDFEATTASDFTAGNNATFDNGGTLDGVKSDETTIQIAGTSSLKYTSGSSSSNDWIKSPTFSIDEKQTNNFLGFSCYLTNTFDDGDVKLIIYDETNSTVLSTSADVFTNKSTATRFTTSFYVPDAVTSLSYGLQVVTGNNTKIILLDDIEFTSDPFVYKKLSNNTEWIAYTPTYTGFGTVTNKDLFYRRVGDTLEIKGHFTAGSSTGVTAKVTLPTGLAYDVNKHSNSGGNDVAGSWGRAASSTSKGGMLLVNVSSTGTFEFSHRNVFGSTAAAALTSETGSNVIVSEDMSLMLKLPIEGWTAHSENIITPAKSNLTFSEAYTPTFTGFGTVANVSFIWRQVGDVLEVEGSFNAGTVSATEARISFPSGLTSSTDLIGSTRACGSWFKGVVSTSHGGAVLVEPTVSYFTMSDDGVFSNVSVDSNAKSDASALMTSGERIDFKASVPIAEWASISTNYLAATPIERIAYISDIQTTGVDGGSSAASTWTTRRLNTIVGDTEFASISSNQFTIQPGTYDIFVRAPAYASSTHKIKMYDVTNSSDETIGSLGFAPSSGSVQTDSFISYKLIISSATTYEIRHNVEVTQASLGLGYAQASLGVNEVFCEIKLRKLS